MNTLDDLRTTLEGRADDALSSSVVDTGTRGRQLHQRIRRVRRRRAAGGALAAVVAVAAASTFAFLPGQQQVLPAGPPDELAGHEVPAELTATGWTYEYTDSATGEGRAELSVPASEEPRLVSWAAEGDPEAWTVEATHHDRLLVERTDFTDWQLLAPGPEITVTLAGGTGEAALAAYELTDERPDGLTLEGLTFREQVAGDRLLNASAARGTDTVLLDLVVPEGQIRLGVLCPGVPDDVSVDVRWSRVDDPGPAPEMLTTGCSQDPSDPGSTTTVTVETGDADLPVGEQVRVEARLVDRAQNPVDPDDRAVLGLVAYDVADPAGRLAGHDVPALVEAHGHLWQLEDVVHSRTGVRSLQVHLESGLAVTYFSGNRDGRVTTRVEGRSDQTSFDAIGSGHGGPLVLPRPSLVEVRIDGPLSPRTRLGVAHYVRTD